MKVAYGKKIIIRETMCILGWSQFIPVLSQLFISRVVFHFKKCPNLGDALFGYLLITQGTLEIWITSGDGNCIWKICRKDPNHLPAHFRSLC